MRSLFPVLRGVAKMVRRASLEGTTTMQWLIICHTNLSQVRALRVLEVLHHQVVLGGHGPATTHRADGSASVVEFRWWYRWVVLRSVEIVNLVFDRSAICLYHARNEQRAQRPLPALIRALRPLCNFSMHAGAST